jgi:hypothetical protein
MLKMNKKKERGIDINPPASVYKKKPSVKQAQSNIFMLGFVTSIMLINFYV